MSEYAGSMFSRSEDAGIELVPENAERILSVGISTGGIAEMRMAEDNPDALIIATTIDNEGAAFAENLIEENGLSERIFTRVEDVTDPLPYLDESFDYVYARLVLHYLSKPDLAMALDGLHRVVKNKGRLFAVVRSTDCPDAKQSGSTYDPETGFTTCTGKNGDTYSRYYHTESSIADAVAAAGFTVDSTKSYDEQLFIDFKRTQAAEHTDNVVELVATKHA